MRKLLIGLGLVLGVVVLAVALEVIAAESGEVVVLQVPDVDGVRETRLWVVDMDGSQWLRTQPRARWLALLRTRDDARLARDGEVAPVSIEVVEDPGVVSAVNARMREKYGWADHYVGWFLGDPDRAGAVAIRLEPR